MDSIVFNRLLGKDDVVGSILILISIAMLRGPMAHIRHMMSVERLPFTISYLGTMAMTLYFSLGVSKV